jgi:DNA repair protein RecO (recombination protein O)
MLDYPRAIYILHTRDYRETSLLINLFSREDGRIDAVLNGGKSKKWRGIAREFSPLLAQWNGRSDLKTLTQLEQASIPHPMTGNALFAGLYVNELLVRLLPIQQPHHDLFDHYCVCLDALAEDAPLEPTLRQFEMALLDELGYPIDLADDYQGAPLAEDSYYRYSHQSGFVVCAQREEGALQGRDLLAIGAGQWHDEAARRAAKRLMRLVLQPLLGDKPLRSRGLFSHGKSE